MTLGNVWGVTMDYSGLYFTYMHGIYTSLLTIATGCCLILYLFKHFARSKSFFLFVSTYRSGIDMHARSSTQKFDDFWFTMLCSPV